MIKGFKDFIMRGNVIDLAVAVVIGAAFTAIVTALVDGLINPLIGLVLQTGDLQNWTWTVPTIFGSATFGPGPILLAIINFLAVAAVVYFLLVLPMNKLKERQAAKAGVAEAEEEKLPTEQELLTQIRDLLATQKP